LVRRYVLAKGTESGAARAHEVTSCSRLSKWADSFFEREPSMLFKPTEIEDSKSIRLNCQVVFGLGSAMR
jgi:hypothetical protein